MTQSKIFKHSHTYLNYMFSICQGIFIYENVLMRLKHPESDKEKYMEIQNIMKREVEAFQSLWEDKPFLSDPAMFPDADKVLADCRKDLEDSAELAEKLEKTGEEMSDDDLAAALGLIAKSAYITENFLNGVIAYCEHFNLESDLKLWHGQLPAANNSTDRAGYYLTRFESGLDDRLRHDIVTVFKGYSGIYKSHAAEIKKWRSEYEFDIQT
ncbi:MAG: hypothetical protein JW982_07505 [Spirochaetes bacterium]|nr:hypothetical protein [Spirochaetota bacterium]